MNYSHFVSFSVNECTAGLGVSISFGDELPPPDNSPTIDFWGIRVIFLIFEFQLGVLTEEA